MAVPFTVTVTSSFLQIKKGLEKDGVLNGAGNAKWYESNIKQILTKLRTTDFIRCKLQRPSRPLAARAFAAGGCILFKTRIISVGRNAGTGDTMDTITL